MTDKERFENLMTLGDFCLALANREGNRLRDGEENVTIEVGFCAAVTAAAAAYSAAERFEGAPAARDAYEAYVTESR